MMMHARINQLRGGLEWQPITPEEAPKVVARSVAMNQMASMLHDQDRYRVRMYLRMRGDCHVHVLTCDCNGGMHLQVPQVRGRHSRGRPCVHRAAQQGACGAGHRHWHWLARHVRCSARSSACVRVRDVGHHGGHRGQDVRDRVPRQDHRVGEEEHRHRCRRGRRHAQQSRSACLRDLRLGTA